MPLIDPEPRPLLDEKRANKLIELARERFALHLSEAELNLLRDSASSGVPIRGLMGLRSNRIPPKIRPELVRWLASDRKAARFLDPNGIRVYGVTLPRDLDLEGCHISVPLVFYRSTINGGINLQLAETKGIYIVYCSVEGAIQADRIDAQGPMYLQKSQFASEVALKGARIEGDLDCSGAKLEVKEGDAFSADRAEIGGGVFLKQGFTSSGTIRLLGAQIKGNLECSGAKLEVKEGDALSADGAEFGGSVFLHQGFTSSGTIRLVSAQIGGQLDFCGAKVAEVRCENLLLSGDLLWMGIQEPEKAALSLMGAKVKNLREDRESWPQAGRLFLDGLEYEEVTLHPKLTDDELKNAKMTEELDLKVEDRIAWLMLQPEKQRTEAHPWMFLAKHLEGKGDRKGAKHVVFMYRCLQAKSKWLPSRW
jgi:hypothetical protein